MDRIKYIVAPVASAIAMVLLMFAPSANAQNDRTAVAYDRLEVSLAVGPDLKQKPDPIAESFFRMLAHTPAVESQAVAPRTDADSLREAIVRALWSTSPVYHVQVQPQLPVVSPTVAATG